MTQRLISKVAALAIALAAFAAPARADVIFSQNFETGLGANESTSGNFTINDTGVGAPLNLTKMMGHIDGYLNNEYSYYQISGLNLAGYAGPILMTFQYYGSLEAGNDRFNVLVGTGAIAPPAGLATTTAASQMKFIDLTNTQHASLGQFAYDSSAGSGGTMGVGQIDLSAFAGQSVNIRYQFGSNGSTVGLGINLDNVLITGQPNIAAVPEPSPLMLGSIAALAGAGLNWFRRKRAA